MVTGQAQSHVVPDHRPETCRRECRTSSRRRRHGVKAGSAVPVKFSLGGDRGRAIFAVGFPTSAQVTYPAGTTPTQPGRDDVGEEWPLLQCAHRYLHVRLGDEGVVEGYLSAPSA